MNSLKPYQIPSIQCKVASIQQQFHNIRLEIAKGDLSAVQKLADVKLIITDLLSKINNFMTNFKHQKIAVYLYASATILQTLLTSPSDQSQCHQSYQVVPWKKQSSKFGKSNFRQGSFSNSKNSHSSFKKREVNAKNKQMIKNQSRKRLKFEQKKEEMNVINKYGTQATKKQNCNINKSEKSIQVERANDSFIYKKISSTKLHSRTNNKNEVQNSMINNKRAKKQNNNENLLTIKITEQQYEQILRLKRLVSR